MNDNYLPLYRKYRPQCLEEIVGQEHIKKTLKSAIELNKISHAYLFTGPRGTGKTSTARILAKSLNCINGPTLTPCNECPSCKDVTNTVPIDVIEIDAASNRKVEDTQSILEKIQYTPVHGRYKIYIIDEVHMLTNHAFNALLKTLEEPPENVIFILATTEVHKVLDTIKSRCQRFDFRRITTEDIVKHLRYISDKEGIKINDEALFAIAKNSAGGMRDSIALLDQLSLLGVHTEVTLDDVNNMLGRLSFDLLKQMADCIVASDTQGALELLEKIYNSGNEPTLILSNLCEYFKNMLVTKNSRKELQEELTGYNSLQVQEVAKQVEGLETQQIVFLLERTAHYIRELKQTANQYLWLEVAIIDLANLAENTDLITLQNRVKALEGGEVARNSQPVKAAAPVRSVSETAKPASVQPETALPQTEVHAESKPHTVQTEPVQNKPAVEHTESAASVMSDTSNMAELWSGLIKNINSPSTQALLRLANPVKVAPDEVVITFKQEIFVKQANEDAKKQVLKDAADKLFGQTDSKITIRLPQSGDVPIPKSEAAPVQHSAPQKTFVPKSAEVVQPQRTVADDVYEAKQEAKAQAAEISEIAAEKTEQDDNIDEVYSSDQTRMIMNLFDGKYI